MPSHQNFGVDRGGSSRVGVCDAVGDTVGVGVAAGWSPLSAYTSATNARGEMGPGLIVGVGERVGVRVGVRVDV